MKSFFCAAVCLLSSACAGYSVTGGPGKTVAPSLSSFAEQPSELQKVHVILALPVSLDYEVQSGITSKAQFDLMLREVVGSECGVPLIPAREVLAKEQGSRPMELSEAFAEAKRHNADAVLRTNVHKYTKRIGSALGAEQTACVDFSMSLYRVGDGRQVWKANYFFRDQALADNLFRVGAQVSGKQKLGFARADDLFKDGLRQACADFSALRRTGVAGSSNSKTVGALSR